MLWMMRASVVLPAAAVTRKVSSPLWLMVPANTMSPADLSTGMLSPVTTLSKATRSPGLRRTSACSGTCTTGIRLPEGQGLGASRQRQGRAQAQHAGLARVFMQVVVFSVGGNAVGGWCGHRQRLRIKPGFANHGQGQRVSRLVSKNVERALTEAKAQRLDTGNRLQGLADLRPFDAAVHAGDAKALPADKAAGHGVAVSCAAGLQQLSWAGWWWAAWLFMA